MKGVVIQIELEGSHSELRLQAAADAREIDRGELPIVYLRSAPHTIMNNGKPNPEWPKWSKDLVRYAKEIAGYYELPLALITLDPQNCLAGFKDEQSSSEGQIVSNALNALWKQADCLVLAVDHLGKDASAGLRGTSAKETNPLFILSTGETKKDIHAQRELVVRKMRNGAAGLAIPFWAVPRDVTIRQEVVDANGVVSIAALTEKTLTIRWGDEMRPVESRPEGQDDPIKGQQRRALVVLSEIINGRGGIAPPSECEAPPELKVARLETWRLRLIDKTVIEGKNTGAAFSQIKNALLDGGEIDISAGYVWPKLG
jgi:hypothetical protein